MKRAGPGLVGGILLLLGSAQFLHAQAPPVPGASNSSQAFQAVDRDKKLRELDELRLDSRLRANEDIPPGQRALFDYGGYISVNYLSVDDAARNNHTLRQYDAVVYGRANLDGANELFVRVRTSVQDFSSGDDFENRGDRWIKPDIERGYYRFDLQKYFAAYEGKAIPYNLTVQLGRDLIYWANGLTLGEVIDGAIVDATYGPVTIEGIGGVTPVATVDIDSSRPSFDIHTRRAFYGGMVSAQLGTIKPFVYGLVQRDWAKEDRLTGKIDTKYDYDSYYIGAGATGNLGDHFVYSLEGAYEGGAALSNSFVVSPAGILLAIKQTHDPVTAAAADMRLEYLPGDSRRSRFAGEVILATGDPDRGTTTNTFNGNRSGTGDQAFNAFGLVNTGLAFAPQVSNLAVLRLGASTFPLADTYRFNRLQVGVDVFYYNKLRLHGPIAERTNNKAYLGVEPDFYLNWQITSDVTLAMRYGIFFPYDHTIIGAEHNRQFFYTGVTFAF